MPRKEREKEPTQEEIKAIEKQKHLRFAQSSISAEKVVETSASRSGVTYDSIASALQDPYANVAILQQISKILYYSNGVYYRLIEEFANIPMYDL